MYVTNAILGGSFGSRITSNIRENKGYTYSPYQQHLNRRGVSVWSESADVTSEHTLMRCRKLKKRLNVYRMKPPSAEELKGIQNYLAGIFVFKTQLPVELSASFSF